VGYALREGGGVAESTALQHILDNRAALLAELRRRQAVVRDYVRGVARPYTTGFYLFGRPGTAKTHTVRWVLEEEIREVYVFVKCQSARNDGRPGAAGGQR
jgi:hypothetical protein